MPKVHKSPPEFAEAVTAHTDDDAKDVGGPNEKESNDSRRKGTERSLQCPICSKNFAKGCKKIHTYEALEYSDS